MKTLHLVLKHKWYDMIDSGVKTEEYRDITPYWIKRILGVDKISISGLLREAYEYDYTHVQFHRGYTNTTMIFKINYISVGIGKPEWGASERITFIIKLRERIAPSSFIEDISHKRLQQTFFP